MWSKEGAHAYFVFLGVVMMMMMMVMQYVVKGRHACRFIAFSGVGTLRAHWSAMPVSKIIIIIIIGIIIIIIISIIIIFIIPGSGKIANSSERNACLQNYHRRHQNI